MSSDRISKAVALGYLVKVSAANVNASHTEGNVVVTKKVTLPDGTAIPYVSGQAIRRMLRNGFEQLGFELSEPHASVDGQEVTPPVRPAEFIDEDLFGYLDPSGSRRRTSPVRVSAAVGMFPYQGDRDLGTRSFEHFGKTMGSGGNMFETELYDNLFRGNILIELDRVGRFKALETGQESDSELPAGEKARRVEALLEAIALLWGGGRTARMLTDFSPRFLAYARLTVKHPVFLESFSVRYHGSSYHLQVEPLVSALEKFAGYGQTILFGLEPGFLGNEQEVRERLGSYGTVCTVHEAIARAKEDVRRCSSSA